MKGVFTNFNNEFSADHIKPFILVVMKMKSRSALFLPPGIINAKSSISVFRRYFAIKFSSHDMKFFLVPVFLCFDFKPFFWIIVCRDFGFCNKCRGNKRNLKKQPAVHTD